ncbi:MAG: ATP-dependent DNA ligase [Beggiatoa sp. IS2]|nr:MAG: ATP-dependent DNA ligase [Beggiatoa sp. IS2]
MKILIVKIFLTLILFSHSVNAHFQTLLPSSDLVTEKNRQPLTLTLMFTHPMEQGPLMEMATPRRFGVLTNGKIEDLLPRLKAEKREDKTFYTAKYSCKTPGDYVFFVEPAPYWEAAENKMIVHYTKVVVDAFSAETGWDASVGFPVEIEPLTRPYGLWTGNLFRGIVKKQGQPVPFATVEVEYLNENHAVKIPAEPFITQVIKTDVNGVFSYAMPKDGWWGFAALIEGEEPLVNPEGKKVPVELGGLIWIKTVDIQ